MWGNLILDSYRHYNNGTAFSNNKSDIILHLMQWQYWWWFWFSIFFIFYYNISIKTIIVRSLKFYPKINTSLRPRGRWGDLLIAFIPIYWCSNILINSNSLLKIIEWQDMSNFMTVRVRGKQWYWVYKLDSISNKSQSNLICFLGNKSSFNFFKTISNGLDASLFGFLSKWNDDFFTKYNIVYKNNINKTADFFLPSNSFLKNNFFTLNSCISVKYNFSFLKSSFVLQFYNNIFLEKNFFMYNYTNISLFDKKENFIGDINKLELNSSFKKNKLFLVKKFGQNELFDINTNNIDSFSKKSRYYLTLRQKPLKAWFSYNMNILNFSSSYKSLSNFIGTYIIPDINTYSLSNSNRLLNTTSLLVIPTNMHLSIISNSFDVIHSWFIPGLGIKIDCVPGRSTHHSLFIDIPGFYYGQCAEICGRFHHHMPIKICALVFEHFLLWWQHYFSFLNISDNWEDSLLLNRKKYNQFFN